METRYACTMQCTLYSIVQSVAISIFDPDQLGQTAVKCICMVLIVWVCLSTYACVIFTLTNIYVKNIKGDGPIRKPANQMAIHNFIYTL